MVLIVTVEHAPQPFSDLCNRLVHPDAKFLLDILQFLPPPFAVRNALDFESAQSVFPTDVLESQKGERLRLSLSTLLPVLPGESSESNQLRLVFVQFQPELAQSFL